MQVAWTEIFIIITLVVTLSALLYVFLSDAHNFLQTRVPFVPTRKVDVIDMIAKVGILPSDYVFDLGSGNGKVLFAVEKLTGARTRGFQLRGWPQTYAKLRRLLVRSKTELVSDNFFNQSLSEATIVYIYLYPPLMPAVGEKLFAECKQGTKIICRDFDIPQFKPVQSWRTPSGHKMFLYIL